MVSYNDNFVLFPAHFGTIKWVFAGILTFGGGILYEEDSLNSHLSQCIKKLYELRKRIQSSNPFITNCMSFQDYINAPDDLFTHYVKSDEYA